MKILMVKTARGAEDGANVRTYEEGKEYELGPAPGALDLAAVFVREGWAVADGQGPAAAVAAMGQVQAVVEQLAAQASGERGGKRGRR